MNRGDEQRPAEEAYPGVYLGESSPYQYVPPPLPSQSTSENVPEPEYEYFDDTDTQPIATPVRDPMSTEASVTEVELAKKPRSYFFHRHWREPWLRLVPSKYVVKPYLVLYVAGVALLLATTLFMREAGTIDRLWILAIPAVIFVVTFSLRRRYYSRLLRILRSKQVVKVAYFLVVSATSIATLLALYGLMYGADPSGVWQPLAIVLGVSVLVYAPYREWYRWRARTVLIELTKHGATRITYGEPDNVFLAFNGDGDGNVTSLEGSTEFNRQISWPNKLLFWGCGNLLLAGKVEGGAPPLLVNVPHVKRVQAFLNTRDD